jgi:alkylhydroperoxidase family enzyme
MGVRDLEDPTFAEPLLPRPEVSDEFRAGLRRRVGMEPKPLFALAPVPWMAHALLDFRARPCRHAPQLVLELAHLVVSQDNSCRYCYGEQRSYLKLLGLSEEDVERLEQDLHVASLAPRDRLALEYVRRVSRCNPRPRPEDRARLLDAGFSAAAVAEIVFLTGASNYSNRVGTLLATHESPMERIAARPVVRLLRPLVAWRMRRSMPKPREVGSSIAGPAARLVAALEGSPCAGTFSHILQDAWSSPVLPRRTKALVLAVIGRALGCSVAADDVKHALAEGGLDEADLENVLAHLHSPKLTPLEAALVPFARETVRYKPATLRAAFRSVARQATHAEALEAVGITALANAVCRMSVLVSC